MATAALTVAVEAELQKADRVAVVDAMSGFVLNSATQWLPSAHAAALGILTDHRPGGSTPITPTDLAEYLAMAAPTHCADGWGYLSRALHAYLLGDPHSAWHFAYYSELRAAQSILSACGCGAFNTWNCVLDATGAVQILPGKSLPTHVMVWLALHFLSENSPVAGASIAAATRVLGESIPDLIQYAYPGRSPAATSSNWIGEWLFDLRTSAEDKSFRNRCSYNPHVVTPHYANVAECVAWIGALWQALEPSPGATFMEIDKPVVRSALRQAASEALQLRSGNGVLPNPIDLRQELTEAYARIVAAAPTFAAIPVEYITDVSVAEHPLLLHARRSEPNPATPRPAMARATLLLRVATGMTQNLLRDAGQAGQLGFWLDDLAEKQGLVRDRSELPSNRAELYEDCVVATEDLDEVFRAGHTSLTALINHQKTKSHVLSQAERVVQWSFGT